MKIGSEDNDTTLQNIQKSSNRHCQPSTSGIAKETQRVSPESISNVSFSDSDSEFDVNVQEIDSILSTNACRISDRKLVTSRATAELLNDAAESCQTPKMKRSYTSLLRKKWELREKSLLEGQNKISGNICQLAFDGKKLLGRERMAGLLVSRHGDFFNTLKTFGKNENCNAESCFNALFESLLEPENVACLMADTCSLNTGSKAGVFRRFELHYMRTFEKDILALECLYHTTELILGAAISHFDGESASPGSLQSGSVYNKSKEIEKPMLTPSNLIPHKNCNVKPSSHVQTFLSSVVEKLSVEEPTSKSIRDDMATLLVLACSTYRSIPTKIGKKVNLQKYLYWDQEATHHARWLTSANGYLRLKMFSLGQLNEEQTIVLDQIVKFIIDFYVPAFLNIYLKPSATDGPMLILKMRDLLRSMNPPIMNIGLTL